MRPTCPFDRARARAAPPGFIRLAVSDAAANHKSDVRVRLIDRALCAHNVRAVARWQSLRTWRRRASKTEATKFGAHLAAVRIVVKQRRPRRHSAGMIAKKWTSACLFVRAAVRRLPLAARVSASPSCFLAAALNCCERARARVHLLTHFTLPHSMSPMLSFLVAVVVIGR